MEKRGVQLDDEKTKTASLTNHCPTCGRELREEFHCEACGTKPFEKRRPDASKEEG